MEKNELVKRVRDENDRRVVVVHLLEKGERIIQEVIEKDSNICKRCLLVLMIKKSRNYQAT